MSSAREIPGFYYDTERNKYFRIQPDHKVPAGAPHSRSAVKASKGVEEAKNVKRKHEDRDRKGKVRRLNSASYTSLSLALRLGQSQSRLLNHLTENYAARLMPSSAELTEGKRLQSFIITPTGQLYAMASEAHNRTPFSLFHSNAPSRPYYMLPPYISPGQARGSMVSVGGQYLLAATMLLPPSDLLRMIMRNSANSCPGYALSVSTLHENHDDLSFVQIQIRFSETIWDMAVSPADNSLCVALATESGLRVGEAPFRDDPPPLLCPTQLAEQSTVTFKDPNIVMSGERTGIVNFTDIRAPSTVRRLQHSSGVNGISTGRSTNQIIVSGLGTVALYDLRYTKAAVPNRKRARSHKNIELKSPTDPLVSFDVPPTAQTFRYTPGKSLLYMPRLDMAIVACQHAAYGRYPNDRKGTVLLYNASNGQLLNSPLSDCRFGNFVGLAVGRVRDGPESIFVGTETELFEFSVDLAPPEDRFGHDRRGNKELHISGAAPNGPRTFGKAVYELGRERFPVDELDSQTVEYWRKGDKGPA